MARILIVDDSNFSRRVLRALLEQGGHEVVDAADGLRGLEHYALKRPDLVMLDLSMETMPGLDVLEQLLKLDREAAVVIASADIQEATRAQAAERGARGFVNKPFVATEVLKRVEQALAGQTAW